MYTLCSWYSQQPVSLDHGGSLAVNLTGRLSDCLSSTTCVSFLKYKIINGDITGLCNHFFNASVFKNPKVWI